MDTRTGEIFTPEMMDYLKKGMEENGKINGPEFVKLFRKDPPGNVKDLKPMEAPLTPRQKKTLKIRRNDPCPCSSGKKFKRCCYKKNR